MSGRSMQTKLPDLELLDADISVYLFWNTASLFECCGYQDGRQQIPYLYF